MVTQARATADVLATRLLKLRVRLNSRSETAIKALPVVRVSFTVSRKAVAISNVGLQLQIKVGRCQARWTG